MFQLFPSSAKIQFMKFRWAAVLVSGLLCLISIVLLITRGLNYGVDFAGGIQVVVDFSKTLKVDEQLLRTALHHIGLVDASVQKFGTQFDKPSQQYMIHFSGDFADESFVKKKFEKAFSSTENGGARLTSFRFSGLEKAYFSLSKELSQTEVEKIVQSIPFDMMHVEGVSPFGSLTTHEYEVRFSSVSTKLVEALRHQFGVNANDQSQIKVEKVDFVGAKVGSDLKTDALLSVLITIVLVFVYIFLRFDLMYAPGVIVALIHDVLITAGLFAWFRMEFDLTIVAALLTVAGYSINDTIIVYDRIREAAVEYKGKALHSILDLAINQTLSRTIITSGTTMIATIILWVYGGAVIHGFAFALSIGIIVGTYSSIFIASPIILWMDMWRKRRSKNMKKAAA